jgi:hypothetical protein
VDESRRCGAVDLAFGLRPATLGFVAAAVGRGGIFLAGSLVAAAGFGLVVATRLGHACDGRPAGHLACAAVSDAVSSSQVPSTNSSHFDVPRPKRYVSPV